MSRKRIIGIILVLLFISFVPLTIAAENKMKENIISTGYGETSIFGLFPRVSGDSLTIFAILPPFGRMTIAKPRFNGHIGLLLIYGRYQWFANGPPAFSTLLC